MGPLISPGQSVKRTRNTTNISVLEKKLDVGERANQAREKPKAITDNQKIVKAQSLPLGSNRKS